MNKYDKKFYDTEKKINFNSKYLELKVMSNLYKVLKNTGNLNLIKSYSLKTEPYILTLSSFPKKVQEMIIKDVIGLLNKERLIMFFMVRLTNMLTLKNEELINLFMKSLIATKLIKDIKLIEDVFIMTLLNDEKIKFSCEWENKEQIEETKSECHNFCYYIMKNYTKDRSDVFSVTILEKGIYSEPRYHTFLLIDGFVRDYSRNICIKYEDYKKIHNFKVLLFIPSNQLFKNIENKERRDKEFKDSNICKILKCAMDKQMKKDKKYKNR